MFHNCCNGLQKNEQGLAACAEKAGKGRGKGKEQGKRVEGLRGGKYINMEKNSFHMAQETVTIPKEEYQKLKRQAQIDMDILQQLISSFKDIKEGRVRRVK